MLFDTLNQTFFLWCGRKNNPFWSIKVHGICKYWRLLELKKDIMLLSNKEYEVWGIYFEYILFVQEFPYIYWEVWK